jgi:hypothetical protein
MTSAGVWLQIFFARDEQMFSEAVIPAAIQGECQSRECGDFMCQECTKIDQKIAHYTELAHRVLDAETLRGIERLVSELVARKEALHPKAKK